MGEDADRFRLRARQCRDLAPKARVEEIRAQLVQLADELEHEADLIDAEEAASRSPKD